MRAWEAYFKNATMLIKDPVTGKETEFARQPKKGLIHEAAEKDRGAVFSWMDILRFDPNLAEAILEKPIETLAHADEAARTVDMPDGLRARHVRIVDLSEENVFHVRDLRERHLARLIAVRGVVQGMTPVRPMLLEGIFKCARCGTYIKEAQEEHLSLKEPIACHEDQGGCGRDTSFKLITGRDASPRGRTEGSVFVNVQRVDIQEEPDAMTGTRTPESVSCFLEEDLVSSVQPGDRVIMVGVLRSTKKKGPMGGTSTIFDIFLDVCGVQRERVEYEDLLATPEEITKFEDFARDPVLFDKLVYSFAPHLHGLTTIKLGIILQQFGGVEKPLPGGKIIRGEGHILIVGVPGKGKTDVLRAAAAWNPRGVFTNAKTSTGVGLTAAAIQDTKGGGGYILAVGPAVHANGGLLALDEVDKARKEDMDNLLEPMENGTLHINKGGINATLRTKFACLMGGNFKDGEPDANEAIGDQVPLVGPLISRFDHIFTIGSATTEEEARELASTMLSAHVAGAHAAAKRAGHRVGEDDRLSGAIERVTPTLDPLFVKKYIAHARRTVTPILSPEVEARAKEDFVGFRRSKTPGSQIPLGERQLNSIIRVSEQSARARLSPWVELQDLERALGLFRAGYMSVATNGDGVVDTGRLDGTSQDMRTAMRTLKESICALIEDGKPEPSEGQIVAEAVRRGIEAERAKSLFSKLRDRGGVYFGRTGWKLTEGSSLRKGASA